MQLDFGLDKSCNGGAMPSKQTKDSERRWVWDYLNVETPIGNWADSPWHYLICIKPCSPDLCQYQQTKYTSVKVKYVKILDGKYDVF